MDGKAHKPMNKQLQDGLQVGIDRKGPIETCETDHPVQGWGAVMVSSSQETQPGPHSI